MPKKKILGPAAAVLGGWQLLVGQSAFITTWECQPLPLYNGNTCRKAEGPVYDGQVSSYMSATCTNNHHPSLYAFASATNCSNLTWLNVETSKHDGFISSYAHTSACGPDRTGTYDCVDDEAFYDGGCTQTPC